MTTPHGGHDHPEIVERVRAELAAAAPAQEVEQMTQQTQQAAAAAQASAAAAEEAKAQAYATTEDVNALREEMRAGFSNLAQPPAPAEPQIIEAAPLPTEPAPPADPQPETPPPPEPAAENKPPAKKKRKSVWWGD